jgi:HEAT repeat protein
MRTLRVWGTGFLCAIPLLVASHATAQDSAQKAANKAQISRIHELEKAGPGGLKELSGFLQDHDRQVRIEAVKTIVKIGSSASLDPLIFATRDADSEVRVRATDGIVNVYLPGYVAESSLSGYITRGVRRVKSFFASSNDSVIDPDVNVRDDVAQAISQEINFGESSDACSNAALAAGILRLKIAVPALVQALRSKDNDLMFESLVALQKIHDPAAGPGVGFLVRDLDERTQVTALETVGVLKSREAAPDVRYALENARNLQVRRAALSCLAMLGLPEDRPVFKQYVMNGDSELRAGALEGLGRLREPEDTLALQTSYDEANADWRIHQAAAFALVNEGNVATTEFSPLAYLVEGLNSHARANFASAYLKELMQHEDVRKSLANTSDGATRAQRLALCWIFAASDSDDVLPALNKLTNDPDGEVATAAKRAVHIVQTRRSS